MKNATVRMHNVTVAIVPVVTNVREADVIAVVHAARNATIKKEHLLLLFNYGWYHYRK